MSQVRDNLLPRVTVIVVNYNGKKHLQNCFESLQRLNYPSDKIQVICVDNNSSDGSVEFVKDEFPDVHCIEAKANLGFAKGCNVGAREAQSDYLAFLNNDATVHENWLLELVKALQQDEKTVCAGAKILDWNGQTIDFVGEQLNFYGFARQIAWRTEVETGFFDKPKPILAACGGAMLINRQVFLDVGGFDEDYFMFFEDVDLGWRLWILGYKVIFVPEAITYHRFHSTAGEVARHRRYFLYERNALATIIKNYEQANLDRILPVALFLSMHRTLDYIEKFNIPPDALHPDHWNRPDYTNSERVISMGQLNPLMAARDIITNIPDLIEKRKTIQAKRKRSDQEIIKLFGQPLRIHTLEPGAAYALAQENLMKAFQVQEIFRGVGKQILLLTKSGLPMFGFAATPPGLRAEAIGQGLEAEGHEVLYALPDSIVENYPIPKRFKKLAWRKTNVDDIVLETNPDIVIICDWQILEFIKLGAYRPIVLDYSDFDSPPTRPPDFLANADMFICGTEDQRESLRRWLNQAGLPVTPEEIRVIPATISADDLVQGMEPLHLFCQNPSMRKKLKLTPTPLSKLPIKVWRAFQEDGLDGLKQNANQYISWRIKRIKKS